MTEAAESSKKLVYFYLI